MKKVVAALVMSWADAGVLRAGVTDARRNCRALNAS
jgi:hypothetical protein